MGKNFSKISLLLWGGVLLAILYFMFDTSRNEGFYFKKSCTSYGNKTACENNSCKWKSSSSNSKKKGSSGSCS